MKRHLFAFWDTFSYIDLFSIEPCSRITFRNKRVYSSTTGKMMTILCLMCSVGAFVYFGINMITRSSPQTIIAEIYQAMPDLLKITPENFFFSFGMKNYNTNQMMLDETIYVPHLYVVRQNKSVPTESLTKEILIGRCVSSDNPTKGDLNEYFITNPTDDMYCIKNYTDVELFGSEDSGSFEYLQLILLPCQNTSTASACQPMADITDFFNDNYFYSSYTSDAADSLNYETPLNQHGDFYSCTTIDTRTSKVYWDFTHLYVTTDDGVIFQNILSAVGLAKTTDAIFYLNRNNQTTDAYLDLTLRLSKVAMQYQRKYDKLQEVLANTGGAIKIMVIFALIITRPVIFFNFYRDLGNEYFDFEMMVPGSNVPVKKKLKISFFQYCSSFIRPHNYDLSARKNIWDKSKVVLNEQLSLSQILNKIVQLDKLKYLLFDNNQMTLFERMPKPIVEDQNRLGGKSRPSGIVAWNRSFFRIPSENDFTRAVNHVQQKRIKTEVDQRMLKLLVLKPDNPNTNSPVKKYTFVKSILKNEKIDEDTGFPKILSNSMEEEMNKAEAKTPYIDTKCILKDLEMIEMKKQENSNSMDFELRQTEKMGRKKINK